METKKTRKKKTRMKKTRKKKMRKKKTIKKKDQFRKQQLALPSNRSVWLVIFPNARSKGSKGSLNEGRRGSLWWTANNKMRV